MWPLEKIITFFYLALNINLKIGELVQALDVKTMAEQWKAYTMICEKYSNFLSDGDIYTKSTKVLVDIVRNNIKTAVEVTFTIICFVPFLNV